MSVPLRICIYDVSPNAELPTAFAEVKNVVSAGVFNSWNDLQNCLAFGNVEIAAVQLDLPEGGLNLPLVSRISEVAPACTIIGVSNTSDPQAIIAAMRAGCGQFVRRPIDPHDLGEAVERIRVTRSPVAEQSKRVFVVGAAGGSGASTIASNLALEFAQILARKCALVDLNLEFGDVALSFDVKHKYSISDVAAAGIEIDRIVLENAMIELPCNVAILPRPERIEDSMNVTPEGVEQMFRVLGHMFPFVVSDVPRTCHVLTPTTVHETDKILIVAQLSVPFLRNATRVLEYFLESGIPQERLEIVLNRTNSVFDRLTPEEVETHFKRPPFAMIPNDYRRVAASRDLGTPISSEESKSPARRAIHDMARKLAGPAPAAPKVEEQPAGGLLGRFWGRKHKPPAKTGN